MQIIEHTRPFRARYQGSIVMMALFFGVDEHGKDVQGIVAEYPSGDHIVLSVAPRRQKN
jgi:hypothetical protein